MSGMHQTNYFISIYYYSNILWCNWLLAIYIYTKTTCLIHFRTALLLLFQPRSPFCRKHGRILESISVYSRFYCTDHKPMGSNDLEAELRWSCDRFSMLMLCNFVLVLTYFELNWFTAYQKHIIFSSFIIEIVRSCIRCTNTHSKPHFISFTLLDIVWPPWKIHRTFDIRTCKTLLICHSILVCRFC